LRAVHDDELRAVRVGELDENFCEPIGDRPPDKAVLFEADRVALDGRPVAVQEHEACVAIVAAGEVDGEDDA
jgi:hypothetical protein